MQKLVDNIEADKEGDRHVVYSNYIDSGLTPLQKQLQGRGIPLAVFTPKNSIISFSANRMKARMNTWINCQRRSRFYWDSFWILLGKKG
jgi:hypothetical protein